jgi:hypothetical protein
MSAVGEAVEDLVDVEEVEVEADEEGHAVAGGGKRESRGR